MGSDVLRIHGGLVLAELDALGLTPRDVVDFSVNTNTYGPHPSVVEAIRSAPLDRYPDSTARAARESLAALHGVPAEGVTVGNGSADLMWTIARTHLDHASRVAFLNPTFAEFPAAAAACGAQLFPWEGLAPDLAALREHVREHAIDVLYLCSPNTPTGASVAPADAARFAADHPRLVMVLDEAFLSLSERATEPPVTMPPNVIRVRSLTKDHAIPGVRVGFTMAAPVVAARLEAGRPAWTTSSMAQAAVVAACGLTSFVDDCRRRMLADRDRLQHDLRSAGWNPLPTTTFFFLMPVDDAEAMRRRLLPHGVLVRDCASFGLPGHVRIAARPEADCARLLQALEAP